VSADPRRIAVRRSPPADLSLAQEPSQLSQALLQRAGSRHLFSLSDSPESARQLPSATPAQRLRPGCSQRAASHDSAAVASAMYPMHPSFTAMADAPGDTQPDSQMHADFAMASHMGSVGTTHRVPLERTRSLFEEEEDDDDTTDADGGYDYIPSSRNNVDAAMTSPNTHMTAHASPHKFATPAPAGLKRDNSNAISSAARTDSASASDSAYFGDAFGCPPFSLTQVFSLTQARTSPVVNGLAEDPVFQRPSPNFTRPCHSSPMPIMSSPTKMMPDGRSDPGVRSSSEPRSEYVTMKESQERRKHIAEPRRIQLLQQDSWEEPSTFQKDVQHQKVKEASHREAGMALSDVSVPAYVTLHPGQQRGKDTSLPRVVNDDGPDEDHDSVEEFEPAAVDEDDGEDSLDELSQEAPFATGATGTQNRQNNKVQVPETSSHPRRTPHDVSSRNLSPQQTPLSGIQRDVSLQTLASQPTSKSIFRPESSKEFVDVMDSQPDATVGSQFIPRPKSLRYPSSPSTMQYSINQTTIATKTGYTSQFISSSVPPMPPQSSPEQEVDTFEEDRVPSSPPLLPADKEIVYDEHTYDEHSDRNEQEYAPELATVDDDVDMCDDDDLPVAKPEYANGEEEDMDASAHDANGTGEQDDDFGPGHEVPESLEQEEHTTQGFTQPISRLRRQDTIPETEACDATQPSYFSGQRLAPLEHTMESETPDRTNKDEASHAAQEERITSPLNRPAAAGSRDGGSDTIQEGPRIRSLNDIANLPDTQHSIAEEEIEMPRLSGLDELEDDTFLANSPPRLASGKKRKITYAASNNIPLIRNTTPPTASAQGREEQGALAAAHARKIIQPVHVPTATLKKKGSRAAMSKPQRNGALKPVREILDTLSSPVNSPSKPRALDTVQKKTPVSPTRPSTVQTDVEMADADNELDELASSPLLPDGYGVHEDAPIRAATPVGDVFAPNRIFASWPGSHFYPATCIGRSDSRHLQVRFDDSNTTFLDATQVRALDLRVGDHVKVDESGMKKHTYVVVGLQDKLTHVAGDEYPMCDKFGNMTAILEEKQRESMPNGAILQPTPSISVPIGSIYLTTQLWARLRDRSFNFAQLSSPQKPASHMETPLTTDVLATPSFTRRGTALPSFLKNTFHRAGSVASSGRLSSSLFSNMAFVLTSTAEDMDKEAISKAIKANGGQVLEVGFHELFEHESFGTLSSQGHPKSKSDNELTLKEEAKQLGFVALITDSHSRSTKYLQALALNVPCLHLRWVQDSLRASRALRFGKYLLPAGVSTYLDAHGVVRSRTMYIHDPTSDNVSFSQTILQRDLLLQNQAVLLITGKAKKDIEKRQPFVFLTHALGSANVGRCADLAAAAQMLHNGRWDWVYVDNGQQGVADAAASLFGTKTPAKGARAGSKKGKKRKRDSEEREELVARGRIGGRDIRITCAEFVIQSLILGALVEE
jgi:hypothetical protein